MPWKILFLMFGLDSIVLTMHRTTKVKRQDVFRRNAMDSRRTIMRRTTDPSHHDLLKGKFPKIGRYWFKSNS